MKKFLSIIVLIAFVFTNEQGLTPEATKRIVNEAHKFMFQKLFEAAEKINYSELGNVREEYLSNLTSTAPRQEFIVNADISSTLTYNANDFAGNIYISTDNQSTWSSSSDFSLIGTEGYENTWGITSITSGGNNVDWYLGGIVNSSTLGLDYGSLVISQAPNNINNQFPPNSNFEALIIEDPSSDANSNQDILSVVGTYNKAFDSEDINKIYLSMDIAGECCDAGSYGLFSGGTFYLYGIGIVNPDSPETAYAVGYLDLGSIGSLGGFELSSGLLKLTNADLSSEDINLDGAPEQITTDVQINRSGSTLSTGFDANYLFNDSGFGVWPNSLQGVVLLGITIAVDIPAFSTTPSYSAPDQTNPGVIIFGSQHQEGNIDPVLSSPNYDNNTNSISLVYTDTDDNLPWKRSVTLYNDGNEISTLSMIPSAHTYDEGVVFSASLDDLESGEYLASFEFADSDIYTASLDYELSISNGCSNLGNLNDDPQLNVSDIILLVNLILAEQYELCGDMNEDTQLNVQDIILLVNTILGRS